MFSFHGCYIFTRFWKVRRQLCQALCNADLLISALCESLLNSGEIATAVIQDSEPLNSTGEVYKHSIPYGYVFLLFDFQVLYHHLCIMMLSKPISGYAEQFAILDYYKR
ncbi:hypothetical protein P8452_74844 [Trifolium repens]|nr:hypothetical protein P8452_74835 [Trifolium repens]WJX93297.1 hypothetical protein P8452_74839 [Trifolium repens]WJX93303.1 hypothetical protein P8452_74844 [Trifolium repens]